MIEIRQYQKDKDIQPAFRDAMRRIWLSGFDDTPEYFDFFYERNLCTERAALFYAAEGGIPVGAAYLLPAALSTPCKMPRKLYYGYAFAILPEYRGTGIYPQLADGFCRFAEAEGAGILLCPDNPKLLQYYLRTGAVQNFTTQSVILQTQNFTGMLAEGHVRELLPRDAAYYAAARNRAFEDSSFLKWDDCAVQYAIEENIYTGGFCKMLELSGAAYLLLGRVEAGGTILLSETTLPAEILRRFGAAYAEKPLVSYGMQVIPGGRAGLLLD